MYVCMYVLMSYIHTYGGVYIRTPNCRCSQFPSACPPSCQLHLGVGWTPPSAACREDTRQSCYTCTDIRTYVRVYGILTHTNCTTTIVSHLVILLSDSLSLMDCLCSSPTLACRSVNSSLVCRSCPSSAYVHTQGHVHTGRQAGRQATCTMCNSSEKAQTCTYVCMYIAVHIHTQYVVYVRTNMHTAYPYVHSCMYSTYIRTFMHVQYIRTYVHVCTRCAILHKT